MELLARTCNTERMNIERIAARLFVVAGGLFWVFAAFSGTHTTGILENLDRYTPVSAFLVLGLTVGVFLLGMYFENLTAALLFAGAAGAIVWGVVAGWEGGVWMMNAVVLVGPMLLAGVLFLLAARMQNICTLEDVHA
ncbi:MAG: hypothetical protein Q8K89_02255 [Actinomycetota bacterium]|nr:hypothetical protein [Actinomycetota bacterium]